MSIDICKVFRSIYLQYRNTSFRFQLYFRFHGLLKMFSKQSIFDIQMHFSLFILNQYLSKWSSNQISWQPWTKTFHRSQIFHKTIDLTYFIFDNSNERTTFRLGNLKILTCFSPKWLVSQCFVYSINSEASLQLFSLHLWFYELLIFGS